MSTSLTWQQLPDSLLTPLMDQVFSLAEASELWDLFLLHPDQWIDPPRHLRPALDRHKLWLMEADPTLH